MTKYMQRPTGILFDDGDQLKQENKGLNIMFD